MEEIYDYIMNLKDDKGRPRRAERGKTAVIDEEITPQHQH